MDAALSQSVPITLTAVADVLIPAELEQTIPISISSSAEFSGFSGMVYDPADGSGLEGVGVYHFDLAIETLLNHDTTAGNGTFNFSVDPIQEGYLYCHGLQEEDECSGIPDTIVGDGENHLYPFVNMPRIYRFDTTNLYQLFLASPTCKTLALIAFDDDGQLVRMGSEDNLDFASLYLKGGKFNRPWVTDLDGNSVEQTTTAMDDSFTLDYASSHPDANMFPYKIPCIAVPEGSTALKIHWWTWPVWDQLGDRGRLYMYMDNGGAGFDAPEGDPCLYIFVNKEICRTILERLQTNASNYSTTTQEIITALVARYNAISVDGKWAEVSQDFDAITYDAIVLEEEAEYALVQDRIDSNRKGTVAITVRQLVGDTPTTLSSDAITAVAQQRQWTRDFKFGVFPGTGSGDTTDAYVTALSNVGFDYATFLFSWFWFSYISNPPYSSLTDYAAQSTWDYFTLDEAAIKAKWGFDKFKEAGFEIKAHALCYNQTYQIPPVYYLSASEYWNGKTPEETISDLIDWGKIVMDAFASYCDILECSNEAAYTNVLEIGTDAKLALTNSSIESLAVYNKSLLINSAPNAVQWWDYFIWLPNTAPSGDCLPEYSGKMPMTYMKYLQELGV